MPAQLRVVRRRIRTVQSTMKITRAQELIAASRVVRAQRQVEQARPYASEVTAALSTIATTEGNLRHPLLERREQVKAAAVLVITSDRGFAGPYNANVLRTAEELMARLRQDQIEPKLYVTGRKGVGYYRFRQRELAGSWTGFSDAPRYDNAREVAGTLLQAFLDHEVDEIHAVFTDFVTAATQRAEARRLIPLVLEELLPRYIAVRVFAAMLESAASEWAARRKSMSAATDNAKQLIESLTREYNQARQAAITQEIMEIVGGAEAMQQTGR